MVISWLVGLLKIIENDIRINRADGLLCRYIGYKAYKVYALYSWGLRHVSASITYNRNSIPLKLLFKGSGIPHCQEYHIAIWLNVRLNGYWLVGCLIDWLIDYVSAFYVQKYINSDVWTTAGYRLRRWRITHDKQCAHISYMNTRESNENNTNWQRNSSYQSDVTEMLRLIPSELLPPSAVTMPIQFITSARGCMGQSNAAAKTANCLVIFLCLFGITSVSTQYG